MFLGRGIVCGRGQARHGMLVEQGNRGVAINCISLLQRGQTLSQFYFCRISWAALLQPALDFSHKQGIVSEYLRIASALPHPIGDLHGFKLGDTAQIILLVAFYAFLVVLEDGIACQGDGDSEQDKGEQRPPCLGFMSI